MGSMWASMVGGRWEKPVVLEQDKWQEGYGWWYVNETECLGNLLHCVSLLKGMVLYCSG